MFHCPVLAYIDPMSGAIVLQVIIGGIIGSVALGGSKVGVAVRY